MSIETPKEFQAIQNVHSALAPLEPEARSRVLNYIADFLEIDARVGTARQNVIQEPGLPPVGEDGRSRPAHEEANGAQSFSRFALLFDAARPESNAEKALVAAYWLQTSSGTDSFTAADANKELRDLGHRIPNITDALEQIKNLKPAFVVQLKKAGAARQGRKIYALTDAGSKKVREMIGG